MSAKEDATLEVINKLTIHIENLEMDTEIHILRDDLNKETYESADKYLLNLKNLLGKLIQLKELNSDELKILEEMIEDTNLIKEL